MMLRTHTQTAGSTLTLQQPENNIVRAAVQALAAALGGVQSMALSCFDEAIAIPTQHAQMLAVRTQQMLQHEFGITEVADPLGGSWHVEELTERLDREARELIDHIDSLGGAAAAIEAGFYQRVISDEAYEREQRVASGEDIVVGVNAYVDESEQQPERFDVPVQLAGDQRRRLEALRGRPRRRGCDNGSRRAGCPGRRRREPDAGDHRRRPRRGDAGRDLQRAADGVRRLPACLRSPDLSPRERPWAIITPP